MTNITSFIPIDFDPFADEKEIEKITFTNDSQREIWLSCILGGNDANLAYNESVSLQFDGIFHFEAFKRAIDHLVLRHEALRATISANGETLIIYKDYPVQLELQDLSNLDGPEQKSALTEFLKKELDTPLDLIEGPLFRVFLHRLNDTRHYFTIIKHHVIGDGWSTGIMLEDLSKMYNAYIRGIQISIPAAHQLSDYSAVQAKFKQTEAYRETEDYWLNLYKDNVPVVDLHTDYPRKAPRSYHGNRIDYPLPKDLISQLKTIGAKAGCSLVTTLLSAFEVLIYHKTNQRDIVIGLPSAGQAASGLTDLVGHCVNLLPLKTVINPTQSFTDYLKKRKGEVLDAYDHQRLTFGELIKKLYIPRDSSRITLVPIIFNIDMGMDQAVSFDGLNHHLISNPRAYENFELYLNATGSKEGILLEWSYNTGLFKQETIEQFHKDYESLLAKIVADPSTILTALLEKPAHLKKTPVPRQHTVLPVEQTLNELLNLSAKRFPDHVAINFNGQTLSYQELHDKSNKLARFLISKGVQVGDKLGISIDRSLEMIIALLAIVKTGSAYVPIDVNYPAERISFILDNAAAKYLLISGKNADRYKEITSNTLLIEEALDKSSKLSAEDPAVKTEKNSLVYILHTSGSTGTPKGVSMGQNALVNLLLWQAKHSKADSLTKTLQFSPISFDVSFQEIFATLAAGGTLVLIDEELRLDPFKLLDLIQQQDVNRIFLPFVALQSITETAAASHIYPTSLQEVMTAGEQLKITPQIVSFFSKIPEAVLFNQYGPTEAHVVTELKLSGDPSQWPNLPNIGREVYNTRIFILDESLQEIPEGEVGELCISGLCLAEGYLNLPEMTAEKFTYLPETETRIYRTGDLARFLPDGNIEFLGRMDHQVKIRGYRIELGEIEAHLNKQESVKQAVVKAQEDKSGNKKLIAYVTSDITDTLEKETVSWHERWENVYDQGVNSGKAQPFAADQNLNKSILNQMPNADTYALQAKEWIVESTKRIKDIGAKKIIEIGCGGGQFIIELSGTVTKYIATDYSAVAIDYINKQIEDSPEKWANVTAIVADANDFSKLSSEKTDLVLINSVIQYFPNAKYLLTVIEQAVKLVNPGGCVFIGDVQERATAKMHHASEQLLHSAADLSIADFEERVNRRIEIEDELLIDPEFFYFVQKNIPGISHCEIQLRKGHYLNETTKYHYDVWLYVNAETQLKEADTIVDWSDIGSLALLKDKLATNATEVMVVKNIPNQRTWSDYNLVKLLNELPSDAALAELKNKLDGHLKDVTFVPDTFWELGEELGLETHVRSANDGSTGTFEAVFIPKGTLVNGYIKPTGLFSGNRSIDDFEESVHILNASGYMELINTWRNNLKQTLPEYMVPNEFVVLNKLPLTATGKIDRKVLPVVTKFTTQAPTSDFIAPRTTAERLIAKIWSDLLGISDISIDSDFFELGGHSLIAVKAMVAIEKETGRRLPLATLFENSTIERLAKMIAGDEAEIKWDSLVAIKKSGNKMPIYMIHGGGLNVLVFNSLGKYMSPEQPVYGMQALGLNGKMELLYSMEDLADRYNAEILDNDPEGPYALAGYSFGGLLAYEMARRLIKMGKEVKMLGILDTYAGNRDRNESAIHKAMRKIIRQFKKIIFFGRLFIENPRETHNYQTLVLTRKIKNLFNAKPVAHYEVFSYNEEISKSYDIAYDKYLMEPLNIKVDIFSVKKRLYYLDDPKYLGWKEYALKGVEVHDVPGDHKTFLFPPHDQAFAEILQKALDSKQ